MEKPTRAERLQNLQSGGPLDVLVIGGGITGASVYYEMCRRGYRTGLVDRGDFASGTSQASGMMVWGGLLYLKHFDIHTVIKFCRARDNLIERLPRDISPGTIRFLASKSVGPKPWFVMLGLYFYWLLGSRARHLPRLEKVYPEQAFVQSNRFLSSLTYEEGFLNHSDSRFVLQWISSFNGPDCIPVNHCSVMAGRYAQRDRLWYLDLADELSGQEMTVKAKEVINCGGVWADEINRLLGIESPFRHVFSKGVYVMLHRSRSHEKALVVETGSNGAVLTYVPWGPTAMWGPTETAVTDLASGFQPDVDDIRYLLRSANQSLKNCVGPQDIVSIRCGIRPLGVRKSFSRNVYPLELSRKYLVADDKDKHAMAVYGGKLTACGLPAAKVADRLKHRAQPTCAPAAPDFIVPLYETNSLSGFPEVSPSWSRDREFCETLEDYLRRRTNISQWVERMGLGAGIQEPAYDERDCRSFLQ